MVKAHITIRVHDKNGLLFLIKYLKITSSISASPKIADGTDNASDYQQANYTTNNPANNGSGYVKRAFITIITTLVVTVTLQ